MAMEEDYPIYSKAENMGLREQDIDYLITTIKDYTNKLTQCIDRREATVQSFISFIVSSVFGVSSGILFASIVPPSTILNGPMSLKVSFFISILLLTFGFIILFFIRFERFQRIKNEIFRVGHTLDVLIMRASQFLDRGDMPFTQRIMLDIILADAEMQLYKSFKKNGRPLQNSSMLKSGSKS